MKKFVTMMSVCLALLCVGIGLTACGKSEEDKTISVESVTINGDSTLAVQENYLYTATITPYNATDKTIRWSVVSGGISDTSYIATDGLFHAEEIGTVTIKATAANGVFATKTIIVEEREILTSPTNLQIDKDNVLTWDSSETNFLCYTVKVNGIFYEIENKEQREFDLSGLALSTGVHVVEVIVEGAHLSYSEPAEIWHIVGTEGLGYGAIDSTTCFVNPGTVTSGDVFIPRYIEGLFVTKIRGFHDKDFTSVLIPAGVTEIDVSAFSDCTSLRSVVFEEGSKLDTIGASAFEDCESLETIVIPAGVTEIDISAFSDCTSLRSVVFEEGSKLDKIGTLAFASCTSLESVIFAEGSMLDTIGPTAFDNCTSLESIVIPASVTEIAESVFSNCISLKSVIFEEGCTFDTIDKDTFFNCVSLESIVIPASVETIGEYAFAGCENLESVIFEEGSILKTIGKYAFYGCTSLESIVIPFNDSVTVIGENAFDGCTSLSKVYYGGTAGTDWTNKVAMDPTEKAVLTGILYYYNPDPIPLGNFWRWVDGVPTPRVIV